MKLPYADGPLSRKRIFALLAHYRSPIIFVVTLQICAALASVALPWILGVVIDRITAGTSMSWVRNAMIFAALIVLFGAVMTFLSDYRARVLGEELFARLRDDLVGAVVHLPLSTVEEAGTGDLLGRTTHDIERIQYLIRFGISSILILIGTLSVTIVAAFLKAPPVAWIILLEVPAFWALMKWYMPRTVPSYRVEAAAWAELSGTATETAEQADTVDFARLGRLRASRFDAALRQVWRLQRYGAWMRVLMVGLIQVITYLPVALIAFVGAVVVDHGWVTYGAVTTVALYAFQLRGPIFEATFWIDEIQTAAASFGRIFGVDLVEPDRRATGEEPVGTAMVARDVHYAYREGVHVLHGVNLDLVEGETLAMVGPSGAGKSTFGRMLAGVHPPTSGSVTVGGVNLVDLDEKSLHSKVALVTQEHHVFVGTIADNLRLARPEASDEDVWAALSSLEAERWVRALPDGLETRVGSGGLPLTPAQAQQLALARIVLLDPHTLVLDEATSLLDPTAARSLERSLAKVLDGRTVIAIAHRLYTAHDADRVAVMIDGKIAELGTHDALVEAGGEYASLWESWQHE